MAPKNMLGGVTACISYTEKRGLPGLWEENCLWKAPRNMKDLLDQIGQFKLGFGGERFEVIATVILFSHLLNAAFIDRRRNQIDRTKV